MLWNKTKEEMLRQVLRQCYSLHRPAVNVYAVPRFYRRRLCSSSSSSESTAATISIDRSSLYNPPGTLFNFPSFLFLFKLSHSTSFSCARAFSPPHFWFRTRQTPQRHNQNQNPNLRGILQQNPPWVEPKGRKRKGVLTFHGSSTKLKRRKKSFSHEELKP